MPLDVFALHDGCRTAHVPLDTGFLQCFEKPLADFARSYGIEISEYADFTIRHTSIFRDLLTTLEQADAAADGAHKDTLKRLRALADAASGGGCITGYGE